MRGSAALVLDAISAPVAITDVLLDAALAARADCVWIEPVACAEDRYLISIERAGAVLATATLEAGLGAAVIARLAYIAGVDVGATRAATGTTRLRAVDGGEERELVFTLRPGTELRAEAMFVARGPAAAITSSSHAELGDGTVVDHYRVLVHLGAGGMGAVYLVEHATLARRYALKVLHGSVLERDASSVDRFLREARAAARIRHPHIVDVFDFGYLADGRPYFVMELLDATSVSDLVARGALPIAQAVAVARQLAEALAVAHEAGVIHADVSASNVLVSSHEDGVMTKLVDFGLAELRGARAAPSDTDVVFGTPCYIAPELIRGAPADERSDQYSYGALLFEMLAGTTPFYSDDVRELCMMHMKAPPPAATSPHGPLPEELVKLVERCLAKSPAARFPNMRALLVELDGIARTVGRRGWRRWLS
ncbi:MAG: serine/threonine protein kinase [Deltaproteobacteria bacterium]|nr:serine/threonine protein kinase [Deltaproteobacteria bacterium]